MDNIQEIEYLRDNLNRIDYNLHAVSDIVDRNASQIALIDAATTTLTRGCDEITDVLRNLSVVLSRLADELDDGELGNLAVRLADICI